MRPDRPENPTDRHEIHTPAALAEARRDAPGLPIGRRVEPVTLRPAVFLDRDGTLIEFVHYLVDPDRVRLLPGVGDALRRLREAGFACVAVTNQSAIGRGLLDVETLGLIHDEMNRQLAAEGTALDGIYYCPELPSGDDPTVVDHPDRKPGPGMLLRAAGMLGLDLTESWMVGDLISDVLTGINAGCRGNILVRTGKPVSAEAIRLPMPYHILDDMTGAADLILTASATDARSSGR